MEAVNISETSVSFYETTRRNIPEDGHLHSRGEYLKSSKKNEATKNCVALRPYKLVPKIQKMAKCLADEYGPILKPCKCYGQHNRLLVKSLCHDYLVVKTHIITARI
jgi:hypothetical protein